MLIGEYSSPLGEKNRVALPKKLRESLSDELVLTRGYERSIIVLDKQRWTHLINEVNKHPLLSMSVRDTKRFLLGGAHEVTLDAQGRFVLPESLMKYAQVTVVLVFVGVGEWLEIWDERRWQEKLGALSESSADVAERLTNVNGT